MNWFLDTCIILFYAQGKRESSQRVTKTLQFVHNKKGKFLFCYYAEYELQKRLEKDRTIIREIQKKLTNPSHEMSTTKKEHAWSKRDKSKAERLYYLARTQKDQTQFMQKLQEIQTAKEEKVSYFLAHLIDKKVIKITEIDQELRSSIQDWIENFADAHIITSGIQYHQKEETILLTGDQTDWRPDLIQYALNKQSLKEKYKKIPQIKYITSL